MKEMENKYESEIVEKLLDIQGDTYYSAYFDQSGNDPEEYTYAMRTIFEGVNDILIKIGYEDKLRIVWHNFSYIL